MVGVDIGCRMHLSVFPSRRSDAPAPDAALLATSRRVTIFGVGASAPADAADHAVLDDPRWDATGS